MNDSRSEGSPVLKLCLAVMLFALAGAAYLIVMDIEERRRRTRHADRRLRRMIHQRMWDLFMRRSPIRRLPDLRSKRGG